jgi:rhodanese-related sulfurtransferase
VISRRFPPVHQPKEITAQKAKLASLLPQDKGALIVAYCGGPKCGAYKSAAAAAKKLGYTNVKHLSAGISGWKKAGEAVEKGN